MTVRTLPQTSQRPKGETISLWRHIVGIARELLTMPAPAVWFPPEVIADQTDADGFRVLTVRASNARDLDKFIGGTVAGRQIVATKIKPYTWEIHTESNH